MLRSKNTLRVNKLYALGQSKCHFSHAESSYWKNFDEMRKTPTPSYKSYYAGPVIIANPQKDEFQEFLTQFKTEYLKDSRRYNKMDLLAKYFTSQPLSIEDELIKKMDQNLNKSSGTKTNLIAEFDDKLFVEDIVEISNEIKRTMELDPIGWEVACNDWFNLVVKPNRIDRSEKIQINEAFIGSLIRKRIMFPLLESLNRVYGGPFSFGLQEDISIIDSVSRGYLRPDSTIHINQKFQIPFEHKLQVPDADQINKNNLLDVNGVAETLEYMLNYRSRAGIVSNLKTTVLLGFMHGRTKLHYKVISHKAENLTVLGALLTFCSRTFKGQNNYGKPSVGHLNNRQVGILSQMLEPHKANVSLNFEKNVRSFKEKISNLSNGKTVRFAFKAKNEFDDTFKWIEMVDFDQSFQTFIITKKDYNKFFTNSQEAQNEDEDVNIEVNVFNLARYDRLALKDMWLFEEKENDFVKEYNATIREYEKIKNLNQGVQKIAQPTKISNGYLEIKVGDEFAISGPFIANLRKLSPDFHHHRYKHDLEKQMRLLHKNGLSIKNRALFNWDFILTNLNATDVTTNVEGNWCFKFPSGVKFTPEEDIKELKDLLK